MPKKFLASEALPDFLDKVVCRYPFCFRFVVEHHAVAKNVLCYSTNVLNVGGIFAVEGGVAFGSDGQVL
jgi:hypothetical protein